MPGRDIRDMAGGALLVVLGAGYALYALAHYQLGSVRSMGPGMFPVILGVLLAGLGSVIALPAAFRSGTAMDIRRRTPTFVLLAIAAFALLVRPFGLIPATVAVVGIAQLAERELPPLRIALLCAFAALLAWCIFGLALGLPMRMLHWPF
jgi:Tripartite tricarboxylate transporter TctB family.